MSFVTKHLKVSLADQLKLIVRIVQQSSYCSAIFRDLEVVVDSLKPGNGNIYLEGILKSNDNKALVMLPIVIADNGSLASKAPYTFFQLILLLIKSQQQSKKNYRLQVQQMV